MMQSFYERYENSRGGKNMKRYDLLFYGALFTVLLP